MHYNSRSSFKNPSQIRNALRDYPITKEKIMAMINDGVRLEYNKKVEGDGYGIPIHASNRIDTIFYIILINPKISKEEQEKTGLHEFVHLHLRRIFNGPFGDTGIGCNNTIESILERETERLYKAKIITLKELFFLTKNK